MSGIDSLAWRRVAQAGIGLLLGVVVYMLAQQRWVAVAVLGVFVALSVLVVARRSRLPTLFEAVFVLAALLNAAGYVWDLYAKVAWWDEAAHLYTGFAVTLALGFLLYEELMSGFRQHRMMFVATITSMGVSLATFWEIFEWLTQRWFGYDMLGSATDTMTDILLGALGALLAALCNLRGLNES